MEITSTSEAHKEFFHQFLKYVTYKDIGYGTQPYIHFTTDKDDFDLHIKYGKRGGYGGRTDTTTHFPACIITDDEPQINRAYLDVPKGFFLAGWDYKNGTVDKVFFPTPFLFNYQVSFISHKEYEIGAIRDWLYANFYQGMYPPCFMYKEMKTTEYGNLGIPACYRLETHQVVREDGKHEFIADFEVKVSVYVKVPVTETEIAEEIVIQVGPAPYPDSVKKVYGDLSIKEDVGDFVEVTIKGNELLEKWAEEKIK